MQIYFKQNENFFRHNKTPLFIFKKYGKKSLHANLFIIFFPQKNKVRVTSDPFALLGAALRYILTTIQSYK